MLQQKRKQALQFVALHRAQKLSKAHLPTEPASYAAAGASQAGGCASPDYDLRRRVHMSK